MSVANDYDRVPYPPQTHPQAQPDRLAAMARIAGFAPTPVDRCRYLELGCADAMSLIAVAYAWPDCECVGVDLSAAAVARGQALVDALALRNVRLLAADIATLDDELGRFDYIAAHGFYAWVPPAVREAALALCDRVLTANGLAYFSFDVFPGAHVKQMSRELMIIALGKRLPHDEAEVATARAFISTLAAATPDEAFARSLRQEAQRLDAMSTASLFHDDLAEHYRAVWFDDFAEHAARHALRFVIEADPVDVFLAKLPANARAMIDALQSDDPITRERATDVVRGRQFRQVILARREAALPTTPIAADRFSKLYFAAKLRVEPSTLKPGAVTFRGSPDGAVTVVDRSAIETLHVLREAWPACVRGDELRRLAAARAGVADDDRHAAAVSELLKGVAGVRLVDLHAAPPPAATSLADAGTQPHASALARHLVARAESVITLVGRPAAVRGDVGRRFLQLLDGTRTIDALRSALLDLVGARVSRDELESKLVALIELRLIHRAEKT